MSEYREQLPSPSSVAESVELIKRNLSEVGGATSGAMLSTVSFVVDKVDVVVAARLVFAEAQSVPRAEHRYPAVVLRDEWLTCDQSLELLRSLGSGDNLSLPCKIDGMPRAERVITSHGLYERLPRASVLIS